MGNNAAKMSPKSFHHSQLKPLPVPAAETSNRNNDNSAVFLTPKPPFSNDSREIDLSPSGESSAFICDICAETRFPIDSFSLKGCPHSYCVDCVVKYIDSKLDDGVTLISCSVSKCGGLLDPEFYKIVLPISVFDRWGKALREPSIEERFYCPYKDCSALLTVDTRKEISGDWCGFCKRTVCSKCIVPFHGEISCRKF